jgi:hypothetical protein
MVTGLPEIYIEHDSICRGCVLGKNVKGSFLSSDSRSKGILDLIHLDVCGPMNVASLRKYLYYLLFIDDHSRKTWIYFLKTKDGVLARFQQFRAQVENPTDEDFPGPNKLSTRYIFNLKMPLSFNCQTRVCCCFITANCSVTSLFFVTVT